MRRLSTTITDHRLRGTKTMSTETPEYFYIEPATWESWVAALGFTAASKLAGACMSYFFSGEIGSDVKLTKTAAALFEGERARLDNRRAKMAAKAARAKAATDGKSPERTSANVENSRGRTRKSARNEKKSRKNLRCIYDNSAQTSPVPAETTSQHKPKPKPKLYNPQTPTTGGATGLSPSASCVMSPEEYDALREVLG